MEDNIYYRSAYTFKIQKLHALCSNSAFYLPSDLVCGSQIKLCARPYLKAWLYKLHLYCAT